MLLGVVHFLGEWEVLKGRCLPHIPSLGYSGDDSGCIVFSGASFSISLRFSQQSTVNLPPNVYPLVNLSFHPSIHFQIVRYATIEHLLHVTYAGALLCILHRESSSTNLLVIMANPDLGPSPSRIH